MLKKFGRRGVMREGETWVNWVAFIRVPKKVQTYSGADA